MFSSNIKIAKSVKIINEIEEGKFPLLLNRIVQFLANGNSAQPFTVMEESKLESSLEITKSDVRTLIDGLIEIYHVCAYYCIKPTLLSEQLQQELNVNPKKTDIIVQIWTAAAKKIIDNLKQKTYFPQLNHISYAVSVEVASDEKSKEKSPKAQLQLGVTSADKREDINLEFNHEQLYEFYKKLEQIQGQLDALR